MDFAYKHIHALQEEDIILWQVKHTLKFAITKIWGEIPTNTKTLSYYQFKKQFKLILLNPQS